MTSDHDLLERMKSLIAVTRRVHVKDAAAMLDLDHVTFLKKVMEWGKTIPFKIDGDDIVVDDIESTISSIDKQFARWESGNRTENAKIEAPNPERPLVDPLNTILATRDEFDSVPELREFKALYMAPFCQMCGRRDLPLSFVRVALNMLMRPEHRMLWLKNLVTFCKECKARVDTRMMRMYEAKKARKVYFCEACSDIFPKTEDECPRCGAPPAREVNFPSEGVAAVLPKRTLAYR